MIYAISIILITLTLFKLCQRLKLNSSNLKIDLMTMTHVDILERPRSNCHRPGKWRWLGRRVGSFGRRRSRLCRQGTSVVCCHTNHRMKDHHDVRIPLKIKRRFDRSASYSSETIRNYCVRLFGVKSHFHYALAVRLNL